MTSRPAGKSEENNMLAVRLRKTHRERGAAVFTLDASFFAPPGVTILFGASGAGKTTLLQCIAGLTEPDSGRITAGGTILFDAEQRISLEPAERNLGFVFQDLALFPHLTVGENAMYGLRRMDTSARETRARQMLESFRIAHLEHRKPRETSGGEQRRVALARSLVTEPRALLLDEPLASLDAEVKAGIMDDLRAWNTARGIPILYVTHDREEALALGERMIVMERGRIVAEGAPSDVLGSPQRESVARLTGFENIFDVELIAVNEANGTMTCRLGGENVALEIPLTRISRGQRTRVAIRAGDILLAGARPEKLSARNVIPGRVVEVTRVGARVTVTVDCGARFTVHVTPGAAESLNLCAGSEVWLIVKSYSCHLVTAIAAMD